MREITAGPFRFLNPDNPPHLTLKKRTGTMTLAEIRREPPSVAIGGKSLSEAKREAATGLLLLWHDHWPEAHAIAQAHEGEADFDLLHAWVHCREGDFSNALYWMNEAGKHPLFRKKFPSLRRVQAEELLTFFKYLLGA